LEKHAILHALERHTGNRSRAARELGISFRTLLRKLKSYDGEVEL
jgi:transcriptional regulator with PAS, ATPase and Fis domain